MEKILKTMSYNGVDLEPYLTVLKVYRPGTADITNERRQVATRGLSFKRQRRGGKTIKVDIFIAGNVLEIIDVLNDIFAEYPAKLVFSDQPDRYYLATLSKFPEPSSSVREAELTLEFESFDGVAHSVAYKRFDNPTVKDGLLTFNVENKGNETALPIIRLKSNSDNGYYGLVSDSGVMAVGNKEEMDGKTVEKSVLDFDYRNNILQGFEKGIKNQAISNVAENLTGTLGTVHFNGRDFVYLQNYSQQGVNSSGSLTFPVTNSTAYDYIWWRQLFWSGPDKLDNQYGFIKVIATDEEGTFLYGVETFKRARGLDCEYNFLGADGHGGFKTLKSIKFWDTQYDKDNPFNEPRGFSDILRKDDVVDFYWWGGRNPYTIPAIKGKKTANIHLIFGGFSGRTLVTRMYVSDICFQANKVPTWEDIPNRYMMGSTVEINSENRTILVNGIQNAKEMIDGGDFLKIPRGRSKISISTSSWCQKTPTATIEFEERWS
ncbi:phage tail family protein [Streptococcus lutetiensis]|nr:phage tail family protein [Streptococcus lutetiensis]